MNWRLGHRPNDKIKREEIFEENNLEALRKTASTIKKLMDRLEKIQT